MLRPKALHASCTGPLGFNKIMKTVFLILLLLTTYLDSFCQTENRTKAYIEGIVVSGVNKKPLADVYVSLKHKGFGTVTDSLGYFRFDGVPEEIGRAHV